ncbi:MAG: flagellar biosynthesis protein FlgA [Betaproteobacteria bacterium HGW-Betaproteobacteria-10]|jgi:(2R)-sulfolactate sulfo-lyase subunit alpha|nr:MAG: flagellar biosynthesis protein FlgA [Betaproteobacteria bacterium HGW-Betaproteobacteria-10]
MIHFVVHSPSDSAGVAIVEGIEAGQLLNGWVLESNESVSVTVGDAIPIGHKLALSDIADGATVIEYGHDIGRAVALIKRGQHLHVHNLKTKRW